MSDTDDKHLDQFNASLPLPGEAGLSEPKHSDSHPKKEDPSADLIRKKIASVYASEPSAQAETETVLKITDHKLSKHQQFILEQTSSGKPMHEIQTAWHEYYSALPDEEKQQVWDEFYSSHPNIAKLNDNIEPHAKPNRDHKRKQYSSSVSINYGRALGYIKPKIHPAQPARTSHTKKSQSPVHSLIFGLSVGAIVMLVFLFSFFNERFIAPFIQPSRNVTSTPIISSTTPISTEPEVIIPKINVEIPVVYDIPTIDESQVEAGLENGVVHYADTAMPGQNGNIVIVGHSSNNIFNPGKYKFAFVLLSRMDVGDTFYLQKDGKRYTYQIYDKRVVKPTDTSVLGPQPRTATATLITCDPPGTSTNRLVVIGEQIDPSPASNGAQPVITTPVASKTAILPGNSISLWSRIVKWLTY